MVRSWLKKLKKKRSFKSSDFSATSGEESALEDDNGADQSPYFTSKREHRTSSSNEHAQSPFSNVINLKDHFKKFSSDVEDDYSEDDRQLDYDSMDDYASKTTPVLNNTKQGNHHAKDELDNLISESGRLLKESRELNGEVTSLENVELFDDSMLLAFQDGQLSFQDFLVSPKHEPGMSITNNNNMQKNGDVAKQNTKATASVSKVEDFEDDGEETERYESGDDSSLDEYAGVKVRPENDVSGNSSTTNVTLSSKSQAEANLSLPGSERTNCVGTPYPEMMIPQPDSSANDIYATPYDDIAPESVRPEKKNSLAPESHLIPGASLEKLAQEMFSDDALKLAMKADLFGNDDDDDFHLSVSQQNISSRDCSTPTADGNFASKLHAITPDTFSKPRGVDHSDSDASDESEHTIVNAVKPDEVENSKRQAVADRKALKSMPSFPPPGDILGPTSSKRKPDLVDLRSKSADSAVRHSCDSPSVTQREVCIVEDKIISAPGSYTRLVGSEEDCDLEGSGNFRRDKGRSNTDPWLAYLPNWKQSQVTGVHQANGRHSRGYASQSSSYVTEGNATDSEISTISGRVSISSEYSTTSGAETSSADERSLKSGLEIDFYLPPPPPIDEDYLESDREFLLDASPFNLDWDYEQSDSPTLTPSSSVIFLGRQRGRNSGMSSSTDDPISESLLAMLPIPDDNFQPVMSQAIGEIITEIISSRQKFAKLARQLDTHEKLLKEHGQQIQKQSREFNELRRPKENRVVESRPVRSGGHDRIKKRAASVTKFVGKGNSRRSRELSDLSCTLDRLLFQCYTLQKNSKAEKETHLYQPLTGAGRRNGRRKTPCEDRIRTKKVKALLLRRAPTVPVYYSQVIPPAKAILKTFNLVSEGIRKPDWM